MWHDEWKEEIEMREEVDGIVVRSKMISSAFRQRTGALIGWVGLFLWQIFSDENQRKFVELKQH